MNLAIKKKELAAAKLEKKLKISEEKSTNLS